MPFTLTTSQLMRKEKSLQKEIQGGGCDLNQTCLCSNFSFDFCVDFGPEHPLFSQFKYIFIGKSTNVYVKTTHQ